MTWPPTTCGTHELPPGMRRSILSMDGLHELKAVNVLECSESEPLVVIPVLEPAVIGELPAMGFRELMALTFTYRPHQPARPRPLPVAPRWARRME